MLDKQVLKVQRLDNYCKTNKLNNNSNIY